MQKKHPKQTSEQEKISKHGIANYHQEDLRKMSTEEIWSAYAEKERLPLKPYLLFSLARPQFAVQESNGRITGWLPDFIPIAFGDIEPWGDFEATVVNGAMRRIFDEDLRDPSRVVKRAFEQVDVITRIEVEEDLDDFFLKVIAPILRHAWDGTRAKLIKYTRNENARMLTVPYDKDESKIKLPQHASSEMIKQHRKRPNFPIYVPAHEMGAYYPPEDVIHVVGDSARTKSLNPKYSFINKECYKKCGLNHLGKMAMYAKGSGTCLAFTMTHIGVTVFRFFIVDGTSRLGVQQRTIPWRTEEVGRGKDNPLSGIQAIYVLMVMSLFPEGRTMRERSQLRSIADWPRMRYCEDY